MLKAITHYDQIPISAVIEIMEREIRQKALALEAEQKFAGDRAGYEKGGSMKMLSSVDIFRVDPKGVLWLESSASVDEAKARIQQFGAEPSDEYLILDQASGAKIVIKGAGGNAA